MIYIKMITQRCAPQGAFIGASLGPMLSLKTDVKILRVVLAIVLIALAVWMVVNIFIK